MLNNILFRKVGTLYATLLVTACLVLPSPAWGLNFYVGGLPPYAWVDAPGPPRGLAVELMQRIMEAAGEPFSPEQVEVINWARAVHEVEFAPGAALLVLARLPEREGRFKWVGPIDRVDIGVFARADSGIVIREPSDILGHSIGVVRNTAPILLLLSVVPEARGDLVLLSSIPTQLRMLREKRLDLIVQATDAVRKMMLGEEMEQQDYALIHPLGTLNLYFGFHKDTDDALIRKLQGALDRLKEPDREGSSPYSRMKDRYLSEQ